ncbi:MAG: metalloregulator ArsR/SmtB family transcription factor [bacterium]|jgi:DNA-binding HxlR family transcriptional regulator
MKKNSAEENLEARAGLLKVLGHPARILILNLLKKKPRHGEELAAILRLNQATVSHHLSRLADAGLVVSERSQYYQTYSLTGNHLGKTLSELIFLPQPGVPARVKEDAYRAKVLKTFMRRGRITRLPAQLKKRQVILAELAREFEPGRDYPEREVNRILVEFHDDVATLRRELVGLGFMERARNIYRRTAAAE